VAEQSWLGSIWDSITGRDKEPAGNGILNYQPEIKPAEDQGVLGFLGPVGRTLQQAPAELPASFVPSDPNYTPGLSESQFIYNQFLGEPIAKIGEGLEGVAQGFGFARQKEMGSLIPELTQSGKQVVGGSLEFAPVGGPSTMAARKGLLRGAEAVERSPVGQGILAMQEQRGMPVSQILAGPGSATADMPALLKANQLETEGVKPQKIFEQTGWYKDIDDQWKYEIPDKLWTPGDMVTPEDVMLKGIPKIGPAPGSKLDDILSHKRLYEAYPEAKNIQFEYDPEYGSGAAFMPGRNLSDSKIIIGDDIFDNDLAMQRILHEVQHGVQSFEGFAVGGNPEDFMKQLTQEKEGILDLVKQTNTALNNIVREKDQLRSQFVPSDDPRILDLDRRYKEGLDYRANLVDSFKYWDSVDLKEEAVRRYKSLAGEAEARNVPRRAKDQGLLGIIPTETTKGDIPKGYQSIEFEPTVMESSGLMDYTMRHRPPEREVGNTLDDLSMIYPEDLYSSKGWMYYGVGGSPEQQRMDTVSANIMAKVRGNPDAEVTVYRAVPKGVKDFNAGDWVTINREYAKGHGEGPLKGDYDIISKKVKASELTTEGNSLHEQGYWPLEK